LKLTLILLGALATRRLERRTRSGRTGAGLEEDSWDWRRSAEPTHAGRAATGFVQGSSGPQDWRFDFHGFFTGRCASA